jgi:hypothetical protein
MSGRTSVMSGLQSPPGLRQTGRGSHVTDKRMNKAEIHAMN